MGWSEEPVLPGWLAGHPTSEISALIITGNESMYETRSWQIQSRENFK